MRMRKVNILNFFLVIFVILSLTISNSYCAIVSENDGAAFISKAEFDSLKNSFQAQIDSYNSNIDSKIDQAITAYLGGIKNNSRVKLDYNFDPEKPLKVMSIKDEYEFKNKLSKNTFQITAMTADSSTYAKSGWTYLNPNGGVGLYSGSGYDNIRGTGNSDGELLLLGKEKIDSSGNKYISINDNAWCTVDTTYVLNYSQAGGSFSRYSIFLISALNNKLTYTIGKTHDFNVSFMNAFNVDTGSNNNFDKSSYGYPADWVNGASDGSTDSYYINDNRWSNTSYGDKMFSFVTATALFGIIKKEEKIKKIYNISDWNSEGYVYVYNNNLDSVQVYYSENQKSITQNAWAKLGDLTNYAISYTARQGSLPFYTNKFPAVPERLKKGGTANANEKINVSDLKICYAGNEKLEGKPYSGFQICNPSLDGTVKMDIYPKEASSYTFMFSQSEFDKGYTETETNAKLLDISYKTEKKKIINAQSTNGKISITLNNVVKGKPIYMKFYSTNNIKQGEILYIDNIVNSDE